MAVLVRVAGVEAAVRVIARTSIAGVVFTIVDGNVTNVFGVAVIIRVGVVVAAGDGGDGDGGGDAVDVIAMAILGFIGVDLVVSIMIESILLSGFDAIETLTSLNRFKWKSNCTSANKIWNEKKNQIRILSDVPNRQRQSLFLKQIHSTRVDQMNLRMLCVRHTNTCVEPK